MQYSPTVDKLKLQSAQTPINIVGIRSRSKITSLKFANLTSNSNLLVAVYKNGEVYIVENPENQASCKVTQIFKHVNGLLLDFSWSADDQLLAFTSMNNEVIIYDVFYQKLMCTLALHTEADKADSSVPVKGVAFDRNSNKYLLTLGDDKILNRLEYHLENDPEEGRKFKYTISQRVEDLITSPKLNKAAVKKLSWSRDDRVLSCPNTAKGKVAMISLLHNHNPTDGETWNDWCKFVGNGFKCTMTQFSPCVYRNRNNFNDSDSTPKNGKYYYILATASYDSTIAIWNTCASAPLIIANEVSANGIQDICWDNDGKFLFITTTAGELLLGVFSANELGEPVGLDDKECGLMDFDAIVKEFKARETPIRDAWLASHSKKNEKDTEDNKNTKTGNGSDKKGKKEEKNGKTAKSSLKIKQEKGKDDTNRKGTNIKLESNNNDKKIIIDLEGFEEPKKKTSQVITLDDDDDENDDFKKLALLTKFWEVVKRNISNRPCSPVTEN
ncbi:unnamed protein product [Ambrosiozyma monospora]|uniref:Unnamed protein product n=1 Tax=Ambrosiozyma monospora TaxID=43982 RepID=A0ACB5TDW6_AMBMO|nr:unnamed protein product [Ambrosiozyma monospora]